MNQKSETPPTETLQPSARARWSLLGNVLGPFIALAVVYLLFGITDSVQSRGTFLTAANNRAMAITTATVAVAALGMTMIIIAGGIDLSAGTSLALCATVLALCLKEDVSPWLAVLATLGTGCLTGLLNGVLISSLRIVPFIITLGTMTIYLGLAKILANNTTVRPDTTTQVPEWLRNFLSRRPHALVPGDWVVPGEEPTNALYRGVVWIVESTRVPIGVWLMLLLSILLALMLRYTVFGRYVFALGSNESTARLCGINIGWNKVAIYTLAGFFIGVAGLFQFSRLSVGNPMSGLGMELKIIAAVVIGGGSLNGGRGSVIGTLAGAAIMAVIASGCTQLGVSNPVQDIILGVIIIVAVTVDQVRQRRMES
jgi:ribose/xylose/arabinose/galactoside ABC-type transport system permease subunit